MSTLSHTHSPRELGTYRASFAGASNAGSHIAMIKRFAKFTLMVASFAIAVTAVLAVRVIAWFPPIHH